MIDSLYRNKPLALGCLCVFWAAMLVDTLPATTLVHTAFEKQLGPLLVRTGLWQGKWDLFAPNMDKFNSRVEAHITWEDGTKSVWKIPDWFEYSSWQKFVEFRRMEYFDSIPYSRLGWRGFASYVAEQESARENKQVRMVQIIAEGDNIDSPTMSWRPAYSRPEFTVREQLHTWYPYESSEPQSVYFGN